MFLQPPLIPLYNQVQPPSNWNPTVYKAREFDMPDQVYIPYDPNAYQKPIKYNYGQNAEASEDSDEPVSLKNFVAFKILNFLIYPNTDLTQH